MIIKAKLRRIGNSMGVILPAHVITGLEKGDSIEIDVITNSADVITKVSQGQTVIGAQPDVIPDELYKDGLAPDGHPVQHTKPMMVGYIPSKG